MIAWKTPVAKGVLSHACKYYIPVGIRFSLERGVQRYVQLKPKYGSLVQNEA